MRGGTLSSSKRNFTSYTAYFSMTAFLGTASDTWRSKYERLSAIPPGLLWPLPVSLNIN